MINNYITFSALDKARVSFVPTHQYIPRGLQGMIKCHVLANPRVQFVTWTKNKRIYDPFEEEGVMALPNGTILIDKVNIMFNKCLMDKNIIYKTIIVM